VSPVVLWVVGWLGGWVVLIIHPIFDLSENLFILYAPFSRILLNTPIFGNLNI